MPNKPVGQSEASKREAALDRINDDPAWAQRAYGAPGVPNPAADWRDTDSTAPAVDPYALMTELRDRRACLVGARETLELVAAVLENADDLVLLRGSLTAPITERIKLVDEAIANTDRVIGHA